MFREVETMAADTRDDFKTIFETSLQSVFPRFGLTEVKNEQKKALFYLSGKDVFVNLPLGLWQKSNISTVTSGCGRDVEKGQYSKWHSVGDFTFGIFDQRSS